MNENPLDKLIRELREENERLKGQLGSGTVTTVKVGLTEEGKKLHTICTWDRIGIATAHACLQKRRK